ncbi:hypothetical protein OEA41_006570 [Lepraria neglecta]|uniref:Uncharacterized protein n=1 Tax=Lepraria neglecta TaxID=209136 RepID=A0AAD9Z955_9LECA|nr:hypothetical protein OEA41_006570 [Lepraria neglecta]
MNSTPILAVPREIRDGIYELLYEDADLHKRIILQRGEDHTITGTYFRGDTQMPVTLLAMLQLNRQVAAEFATNFYGGHTFVGKLSALFLFLRGLGSCKTLIKKVEVEDRFEFWEPGHIGLLLSVFNTLDTLSNLQTLKVTAMTRNLKDALAKPVDHGWSEFTQGVDIIIVIEYYRHKHEPLPRTKYVVSYLFSGLQILIWRRVKGQSEFRAEVAKQLLDSYRRSDKPVAQF